MNAAFEVGDFVWIDDIGMQCGHYTEWAEHHHLSGCVKGRKAPTQIPAEVVTADECLHRRGKPICAVRPYDDPTKLFIFDNENTDRGLTPLTIETLEKYPMSTTTREELLARLQAKVNGDIQKEAEAEAPNPAEPMFKETTPVTKGRKEYAEIIGEAHPSGRKYYFTTYTEADWDQDLRHLIPEVDPTHEFDHDYALSILMGIEYDKAIFAYGPPGSGKSVTPEQICARLNYPYQFIAGMGGTEPSDYVGSPWVSEGSMSWKDAKASFAVRRGVFLLYDEPFKSSAQTNMCFQSLMDSRKTLHLYGHPDPMHSSLKAHSRFRMCLADNVRGTGDQMDRFAAEVQDQSTLNRCAYKVKVDYVPAEIERKLLAKKFPDATERLIHKVVQLANLLRKAWDKGEVELPYSVRDTQEFIEAALIHQSAATAFHQTYYGSVSDESEKKAIRDSWNIVDFGEKLQ